MSGWLEQKAGAYHPKLPCTLNDLSYRKTRGVRRTPEGVSGGLSVKTAIAHDPSPESLCAIHCSWRQFTLENGRASSLVFAVPWGPTCTRSPLARKVICLGEVDMRLTLWSAALL